MPQRVTVVMDQPVSVEIEIPALILQLRALKLLNYEEDYRVRDEHFDGVIRYVEELLDRE